MASAGWWRASTQRRDGTSCCSGGEKALGVRSTCCKLNSMVEFEADEQAREREARAGPRGCRSPYGVRVDGALAFAAELRGPRRHELAHRDARPPALHHARNACHVPRGPSACALQCSALPSSNVITQPQGHRLLADCHSAYHTPFSHSPWHPRCLKPPSCMFKPRPAGPHLPAHCLSACHAPFSH